MTARDTSALSHASNAELYGSISDQIMALLSGEKELTRRQISIMLHKDTATISGVVTPLLERGLIVECDKIACPVTGRRAYALALKPSQLRLI